MAKRLDCCSGEVLLVPCTRKKRLQRKMTTDHNWIGTKKILSGSVSREVIIITLFTCLCSKNQLDLRSINCHIYTITGTCSVGLRVLAASGFCEDRKPA